MRLPTYPLNSQAAGGESVVVATINLQNNPNGKAAIFADYIDHAIMHSAADPDQWTVPANSRPRGPSPLPRRVHG